jgi:hypothetical protein
VIAASWGANTPFYTPDSVLTRGFRRRGIEPLHADETAKGTYFVAHRLDGPPN